jgi:hypothetical protein
MLSTVDFDEDLVDEECISVSPVSSLQAASVNGTEFDAPEADRFPADGDFTLGQ